ncbi:hypothetical protein N7G274_006433 [Stereocaulon virgatum]|uniref:Calcipressin n=1 Tax=Stereocaulon virgatum TaxID=373712 RepID=A0ABR4A694_9LECA
MHARSIEMSPPVSPSSDPLSDIASEGTRTPLSLDLSSIPPLITPHPPSNTLLITNLNSPSTFHPSTLQKIRTLLSTPTPLNSFSPLRSFHRIIVSYPTAAAALSMRHFLSLSTNPLASSSPDPVRLYFGEPTPIVGEEGADQHLKAPSLGKLLFISPPPSPPCGWESREEGAPNRDVIAEDLKRALAGVDGAGGGDAADGGMSEEEREGLGLGNAGGEIDGTGEGRARGRRRSRSGSLCVYHPRVHGDREDLPKVMVVDTTADGEEVESTGSEKGRGVEMTKTARPPVELMEG